MAQISSLARFFKSGKLSEILKQDEGVQAPTQKDETRKNGRPLLTYGPRSIIEIRTSDVPQNIQAEQVVFNYTIKAIKTMLSLPPNYMEDDPVYVLWEIWKDRANNLNISDVYSADEEMSITNGPNLREPVNVVRYFVQIDPTPMEIPYRFKIRGSATNYVVEERLPYYKVKPDNKPFLDLELGKRVDCTTIGTSCGKLFSFPTWMKPGNVANFIKIYNSEALTIIQGDKQTKKIRKEQYNTLKKAWIPAWFKCVRDKKAGSDNPLGQWNNTFDLALLYDHNFTSMSIFTWFGSSKIGQLEALTENDFNEDKPVVDAQIDETNADFQNEHYLLPYSSSVRYRQVWSKSKLFEILFTGSNELTTNVIKPMDEFVPNQEVIIRDRNSVNIFTLLKQSNGVQAIELSTLASVLGSECHAGVSNFIFNNKTDKGVKGYSAITDPKTLAIYATHLPPLVKEIADDFVTVLDIDKTRQTSATESIHNLLAYIITVEFPVYLFFAKSPEAMGDTVPFYSRIDAISYEYQEGDEYSVWEYKTRWGEGSINKPNIDAIRQAAFYCYCLQQMTKITCKYFYIRYVKETQGKLNIKTFKYQYDLGNGDYLFDFQQKIDELVKEKKLK